MVGRRHPGTIPTADVNADRALHAASMRRLVERGLQAMDERDGLTALHCFQRASDMAFKYRLGAEAQAGTQLNLALAHRLIGDLEGAASVLQRLLQGDDLVPDQRAMVWNILGTVHFASGRYRPAAHALLRAWRLMRNRRYVSELRVEVAGNLATVYLELRRPTRALTWASRAAWQARHAGTPHRQFATLQLIAARLALGQTERAARGIARLERSILPEHASLFWRLYADYSFRTGDQQQAVALAARSLDAAVCDLSAEDITAAARALARHKGCDAAPHAAETLIAYSRTYRSWITAFATACQQLELAREKQVVALLVAADGLILTRAGGEEILHKLTLQGYHAGGRMDAMPGAGLSLDEAQADLSTGSNGMWGWAQITADHHTDGVAPAGGGTSTRGPTAFRTERRASGDSPPAPSAWVFVWPPQPAMARAIATLSAHIRQVTEKEQQHHEEAQALAKLTAFHRAAVALGGPLPTPELIGRLLALTQQISRSDGVALLFTERDRGIWADGLDGRKLWRSRVTRRVATTGRPGRLSVHRPRDREELGRLGLSSLLLVPVFFGGDSCSAVLAAGRLAGPEYTEAELELVTFISRQFGLALENAALRDDLSQRLDTLTRDLQLARRLQEAFLPPPVLRHEGIEVAGQSLPAKFVGGDLYDYVRFPGGGWALVLGDVMGKGVAAAMLASMLLSLVREVWARQAVGEEVIRRLDLRFAPDLHRARALATLVMAHLDPGDGTLRAWLAGHDGPILWHHEGWRPLSRGGGTALGLQTGIGSVVQIEARLEPGDVVLFYSDGLGELLLGRRGAGRSHDVAGVLNRLGLKPQPERLQALLGKIRSLAVHRTLQDDVTVVMISVAQGVSRRASSCADGVLLV